LVTAKQNTKPEPTDPTEKLLRKMRALDIRRNLESLDPLLAGFSTSKAAKKPVPSVSTARLQQTPDRLNLIPLFSIEARERTALTKAKESNPEETDQIKELTELRDSGASVASILKAELQSKSKDRPSWALTLSLRKWSGEWT
jgi:hypothetical protein